MANTRKSGKDIVVGALREIVEAGVVDRAMIDRYFSPEYVQHVDGKTLGYAEMLPHLLKQKEALVSVKVTILGVAEEGDFVFTNHEVVAVKKTGERVRFKVLAQFTVRDQKIIGCDELTRMIEGHAQDRDLGSRH